MHKAALAISHDNNILLFVIFSKDSLSIRNFRYKDTLISPIFFNINNI